MKIVYTVTIVTYDQIGNFRCAITLAIIGIGVTIVTLSFGYV